MSLWRNWLERSAVNRKTSLFGGSMACNCGYHVVKPANAPQSVASVSAPGATASAQRTFLRPPPSLSMYTKSRFGGSQSVSLKPHLVPRKSPSSSPPSPSSVRTSMPAPSSVRSPSPSSVRTSMPAPSSVSSPSTSSVRTSMPAPSPVSTAVNTILAVGSNESGGDELATAAAASFWLPREMSKAIPVQDQRWISNTLFNSGKLRPHLKLWYEPPVPALIYHQTPMPDRFFTHRLMVWMPYHLWNVRVFLPNMWEAADGRGQTVRDQLDLPHQKMFRLILTHKYACDIRVIRLLRERNTRQQPNTSCEAAEGEPWGGMAEPVGTLSWGVWTSTKKITKKLSGHAKGTALWVTSIGNEVGQIVTSVLTVQEGPALDTMVSGV
ncbi:hypothetical protein KUCAC02_037708 [Chaenocephalus aceratus]|nr:hypothetical protein KUCAC02_037708 [Chaenocephalus aceratus]